MDTRRPYHWAYDFIFDRLRMVRREIVIQQFDAKQTIRLLEPICMFLAFSSYKLCAENIEKYDPKICHQHLQECLNVVLCCYKQLDEEQQKQKMEATLLELQRRCFIESLYQVFNMGTSEALKRALTLPAQVREDDNFKRTFGMCLEYHRGNLYRVIVAIPQLPHILCALAALKLQIIRRRLLEILNVAYSNKQLTVPSSYLLRLTLCTTAVLVDQCRHYNIALTPDRQMVHFSKTEFNRNVDTLKSTQESFVDAKFARIYLPEVLLLKKLWL
ncbi:uncharacterized protein LOC108600708 isoform X2 [Drosophila busckii]|nr:uncharacterized protein LOC108600708 isoform X2 [Drosophila busckii]